MAIAVAVITLVPDYEITMMLIGSIKLKYLVLAYVIIDLIGIATTNPADSFAHLGGAFLGFGYIQLLQKGKDWSNIFKKKPKLRVVRNDSPKSSMKSNGHVVNQKEVDAILDKISKTGYNKLSKEEKETLFKASKN